MPTPAELAVLRKLQEAKTLAFEALEAGLRAYATGNRGKPLVDRHFTAGNQQRYGWAPLSRDYFLAKQGEIGSLKKRNFRGSRLDEQAEFQSSTGELVGIGVGKNLPMLVRTGLLRKAVTAKNATIEIDRTTGRATITFHDLPQYAAYHHEGTGKMPKRSPVEPNAEDMAMVQQTIQNYVNERLGAGRQNPRG